MKVALLLVSCTFVHAHVGTSNLRRAQVVAPLGQVTKLRLINADTNQPIGGYDPLPKTALIDLTMMPTSNLTIEAITNGTVGSVRWAFEGTTRNSNHHAHVMCGKNGLDFYRCNNIRAGKNFTIDATPFSGKNGTGSAGRTSSIRVVIFKSYGKIPLPMDLTVVNADTSSKIGPLINGTIVSLRNVPQMNVLVTFASLDTVGSVTFTTDRNVTKTDSLAPFTFANTNGSDTLDKWTPPIGRRSLTVRAYSEKGGRGTLLSSTTVHYVVEKGTLAPTRAPVTMAPTHAPVTLTPTRVPVTLTPTRVPVTLTPTRAPVTLTPTRVPVTMAPTSTPTLAPVVATPLGTVLQNFVAQSSSQLDLANGTVAEFQMTLWFGTASRPYFIVSAEDSHGRRVKDYEVSWTPVVGTHVYTVRLDFPRFSPAGRYLLSIQLMDDNYVSTVVNSTALARLGFPSSIDVIQTTLDVTPPALVNLKVSPTVVTAGATTRYIAMDASWIDDQSGLAYVELVVTHVATGKQWYKSPRGDYFPLVNETFDFGATFTVTKDSLRGNYTLVVSMRDVSGNADTLAWSDLVARGLPGFFTIV